MYTVLLVDDDPAFRTALGSALQGAGYEVLYACDGDEAIQILEERHKDISLAIVDLVLPGSRDGFQVIGAIARRQTSMKAIAITGRLRSSFLDACKYMGADAVIRKPVPDEPFPVEEWLDTVQKVLSGEADRGTASSASG